MLATNDTELQSSLSIRNYACINSKIDPVDVLQRMFRDASDYHMGDVDIDASDCLSYMDDPEQHDLCTWAQENAGGDMGGAALYASYFKEATLQNVEVRGTRITSVQQPAAHPVYGELSLSAVHKLSVDNLTAVDNVAVDGGVLRVRWVKEASLTGSTFKNNERVLSAGRELNIGAAATFYGAVSVQRDRGSRLTP